MKKAINQELMRVNNKKSILELIFKKPSLSKAEIATTLGLSSTTVTTFVNELMAENRIIQCGIAKSTGGRKSALYQLNPEAFYIIGVNLLVDKLVWVLVNSVGAVIRTGEISLSSSDELYIIDLLNKTIDEIILRNNIASEKISGIGIGIPGIVQNSSGIVELAPNLGWKNVNLRQLLNTKKLIFIENEANAAAIGEHFYGTATRVANLLYVSIGVGIGCGLILNDRLYTGHSNRAGEFGHMTVEPGGLRCRCGNHGCWEAYASNDAALQKYNHQNPADPIQSFEEFLSRVTQKDAPAIEVLDSTIKYLGIGIANLINGLNPEMVVIGGELGEINEIISHKLIKQIKDCSLDKTFSNFILEFSKLKNRATALGVATQVMEIVFNQ